MMLKDSTQPVAAGTVMEKITELNKEISFSLVKKSIENQLIKQVTPIREISDHYETDAVVISEKGNSLYQIKDLGMKRHLFNFSEVTRLYGFRDTQRYSGKTQRWEGYVINVNKYSFTAKLEDLTNPGTYEIMDFDLDELSPDDEKLLKPGAIFYFSIGFTMSNGQREKKSLLRFKRIAPWAEAEYDKAIDRADTLLNNIKWD